MFQDSRWFLLGIAVPYQTMKNVPSGSEVATNQISELESFNQKTCEKNWVTGSKPKHWSSLVFWWILYHTLGCQDSSDPWGAGRFWSFFPAQEQWKAGRDPGFDPKFFTVVEVVVFFFCGVAFFEFHAYLGKAIKFRFYFLCGWNLNQQPKNSWLSGLCLSNMRSVIEASHLISHFQHKVILASWGAYPSTPVGAPRFLLFVSIPFSPTTLDDSPRLHLSLLGHFCHVATRTSLNILRNQACGKHANSWSRPQDRKQKLPPKIPLFSRSFSLKPT